MRLNGRIFEAVGRGLEQRDRVRPLPLRMVVRVPEGEFVIEQAPVGTERELAASSPKAPVGSRWARADSDLPLRDPPLARWRDPGRRRGGRQPAAADRGFPLRAGRARSCANVPMPVWGRDELGTGEMWNSNSVVAWLIARSGLAVDAVASTCRRARSGMACRSARSPTPGRSAGRRSSRGSGTESDDVRLPRSIAGNPQSRRGHADIRSAALRDARRPPSPTFEAET